ncbi:MAG: DMT family transporter [Hyphomicrobiaceae bacterium]|nr:DMT family transporter [Hyphomicrobiaceae bacterium]
MTLAVLCFACLDTTAKHLGQTLPTMQVVWMRFVSHLVLAILILRPWCQPDLFRSRRPVIQTLRGFFILGATLFNFLALRELQLAEAASIMFAAPFVVAALAGPLLGEWAGPRRWAAIAVGFVGVLIVTRPGIGGLGPAAFISMLAMLSYALYSLTTRMLAGYDTLSSMIIASALIPSLALAPLALPLWVWPSGLLEWGLMLVTGAFGGIGHVFLIEAHKRAPAPTLAPFIYSQIVWMVLFGWIVFADVPTWTTLVGAGVIVASGLYLLGREHKRST